jgi:hypothetical protein
VVEVTMDYDPMFVQQRIALDEYATSMSFSSVGEYIRDETGEPIGVVVDPVARVLMPFMAMHIRHPEPKRTWNDADWVRWAERER